MDVAVQLVNVLVDVYNGVGLLVVLTVNQLPTGGAAQV